MTYFFYQWVIKSTYIWIKVYIKDIFINNIRKRIVPFWIVSEIYFDCSEPTNASNPHAYTQFTITNGEISSQICIEKRQSKLIKIMIILSFSMLYIRQVYCILDKGIIFWIRPEQTKSRFLTWSRPGPDSKKNFVHTLY